MSTAKCAWHGDDYWYFSISPYDILRRRHDIIFNRAPSLTGWNTFRVSPSEAATSNSEPEPNQQHYPIYRVQSTEYKQCTCTLYNWLQKKQVPIRAVSTVVHRNNPNHKASNHGRIHRWSPKEGEVRAISGSCCERQQPDLRNRARTYNITDPSFARSPANPRPIWRRFDLGRFEGDSSGFDNTCCRINRSVDLPMIWYHISDALWCTMGLKMGAWASNLLPTYNIRFRWVIWPSELVTSRMEKGMARWLNAWLVTMVGWLLSWRTLAMRYFPRWFSISTVRQCLPYTMDDVGLLGYNITIIDGRAMRLYMFISKIMWVSFIVDLRRSILRQLWDISSMEL